MPKKLLIVDDEASMRGLYRRVFSGKPYTFTLACGFSEASELLSAGAYDLLITDINLADGNGARLLPLAMRRGVTRSILISGAFSREELAALALKYGAPDYFCKPFDVKKLLAAVNSLLEAG